MADIPLIDQRFYRNDSGSDRIDGDENGGGDDVCWDGTVAESVVMKTRVVAEYLQVEEKKIQFNLGPLAQVGDVANRL